MFSLPGGGGGYKAESLVVLLLLLLGLLLLLLLIIILAGVAAALFLLPLVHHLATFHHCHQDVTESLTHTRYVQVSPEIFCFQIRNFPMAR